MNRRAYEIKIASQIPPGGSEEEVKERVKSLFKKEDKPYYTEEDIRELEKIQESEFELKL